MSGVEPERNPDKSSQWDGGNIKTLIVIAVFALGLIACSHNNDECTQVPREMNGGKSEVCKDAKGRYYKR